MTLSTVSIKRNSSQKEEEMGPNRSHWEMAEPALETTVQFFLQLASPLGWMRVILYLSRSLSVPVPKCVTSLWIILHISSHPAPRPDHLVDSSLPNNTCERPSKGLDWEQGYDFSWKTPSQTNIEEMAHMTAWAPELPSLSSCARDAGRYSFPGSQNSESAVRDPGTCGLLLFARKISRKLNQISPFIGLQVVGAKYVWLSSNLRKYLTTWELFTYMAK